MQQKGAVPKDKPSKEGRVKKRAGQEETSTPEPDNPTHKEDFEALLSKMISPSCKEEKESGK